MIYKTFCFYIFWTRTLQTNNDFITIEYPLFKLIFHKFCTFYYLTHLSGFVVLIFNKPTSIITGVDVGNRKENVTLSSIFKSPQKIDTFPCCWRRTHGGDELLELVAFKCLSFSLLPDEIFLHFQDEIAHFFPKWRCLEARVLKYIND